MRVDDKTYVANIFMEQDTTVHDPLVTVDGPLSLNPGATGCWTVKTFILHPYADFSLEVVGTISSYIELCSAHYTGHGKAFRI